ncbi:MAG TPA: DUF3237 domain-containing protein [Euzebya sp.]|nr:DUF3237 domain-containing protein [Euzebya sp.]
MTTSQVPVQVLELVPLMRMTTVLRTPSVLDGTPAGSRWIFEVESGHVDGDRLRGKATGSANADWMTVGADGTGTLDVRALLETDDGALVFIQYHGRVDLSAGLGAPLYSTPRFETGDDRYRWLNRIQAVGKGTFDGTTLTYDIYELR